MANTPETLEEHPSRRKVRELTAQGFTPRQIAAALGLSVQGVHHHLKRLRAAGLLSVPKDVAS